MATSQPVPVFSLTELSAMHQRWQQRATAATTLAEAQALLAEALQQQETMLREIQRLQEPAAEATPRPSAAPEQLARHLDATLPALPDEATRWASEQKYRTLFEAIDEGFCVIELQYDAAGQAVDWRYVEANPTFERQTGLQPVGKTHGELLGVAEPFWLDFYARIAETGVPARTENRVELIDRWYNTFASRIDGPGSRQLAVILDDITARKRGQANLALLADISLDLARLASEAAIMQAIGGRLATHLGLDGFNFCDVDEQGGTTTVKYVWNAADVPQHVGTYRIADYMTDEFVRAMRAGENWVVGDTATDPRVDAAATAAIGLGAYLVIPYHRQGTWCGVFTATDRAARDWAADDIALVEEVSNRTFPRLERARAEAALRASEEKYRTLFDSIDEGYCLAEVLFNEAGQPVDLWLLEANQVYQQQSGLRNVVGRRLLEVMPDVEPHWLHFYGQVVLSGQPARREYPAVAVGRWYTCYASRVGGEDSRQIAIVFDNITERKQREQQQQFVLQLNDALRHLADPAAVQATAMQVLGRHLGVHRAFYGDLLADDDTLLIGPGYASELAPLEGQVNFSDFNTDLLARYRQGQTVVLPDVPAAADFSASTKATFAAIQVGAAIGVPLVKNGQVRAILSVHQAVPRSWTAAEIALLEETAERTWAAVERAKAEEARRVSEERFRNLVEAYAQAVWETDARGVVVQDSPSWRAYTGQTEAEWLGYGWVDVIHPDDRAYAEQQWREAVAAGCNVDTEFRLRCAAGGYRWTNIRATPLRDAAGRVRKWAGMNIDIDSQKRATESLRRSKDRLRLAIEAAELATWDWNLATNQVRWNARHFTLFGMAPSPDPVAPADFERHVHPDDRAAVLQLLQAAAAERTLFQAEFRIVTDQGDLRWMSGHGQPTSTAPDGRTLWMSGVMRDITDRKHTEQQQQELAAALERKVTRRTQALQASKDLQETVFNTVRHAITVFTAVRNEQGQIVDFKFLLSNGVAERHLGVATAGKTLRTVLPGYVDEDNFRRMVQVVETGRPTDAVLHVAFGNQPIYVHTQYNKLRDGLVLVHEDIAQRLAAERAIQDSRDLLQSVYDTSLVGMAVLHAVRDARGTIEDFTFVSVNKELARATGRPDLVGRRYAQEFPGSVPSGSLALMARAVETGEPQQHEHFYPHEDVNRWYASMYVQLDGGVVATTLDITERKQAEQELRNNLGLLEQSEQVAQLGSWEYELATGVLRWSEGMYRLFDLPPGTPVQPAIYLDYTVAADRLVAERVVRALTTMPTDLAETLRLQVGEEEKTVRLKAVVQRDAAGLPTRVLGVDLDISQVQRLEADNLRLRLSQQQALFAAVQATEEAERRRMSESLHNGIGQLLYATKLQLDRLPAAPTAEAGPRREAARLLGEAIRQTRALSHELTPATLEEFGLEKTLQSICTTLNTPSLRWHCHLVLEEAAALPLPLQLAVYRLAQELAQNVLKHAQATEATLEAELLPGWVVLRVEDNGRGFDPTHTSDGLGLRSLRSRVALLGGEVHLTTAPQEGTQFQLRIPLAFS